MRESGTESEGELMRECNIEKDATSSKSNSSLMQVPLQTFHRGARHHRAIPMPVMQRLQRIQKLLHRFAIAEDDQFHVSMSTINNH